MYVARHVSDNGNVGNNGNHEHQWRIGIMKAWDRMACGNVACGA
jgi:hypothetical protein